LGAIAIVLAMSGSAVATSLITSAKIKDGTIQNKDIKKGTIQAGRLTKGVQNLLNKKAPPPTSKIAYEQVRKSGPENQPGNVFAEVATLKVPAGAYVVTANTILTAFTGETNILEALLGSNGSVGGTGLGTTSSPNTADRDANSSETLDVFQLSNAQPLPADAANQKRTSYALEGQEQEMGRHTGHRVQVTGTLAPPRAAATSTAAATAAGSRTSALIAKPRAPLSCSMATAAVARSNERPTTATDAPACANASAVPSPMPELPPVTSATCPASASQGSGGCSNGANSGQLDRTSQHD